MDGDFSLFWKSRKGIKYSLWIHTESCLKDMSKKCEGQWYFLKRKKNIIFCACWQQLSKFAAVLTEKKLQNIFLWASFCGTRKMLQKKFFSFCVFSFFWWQIQMSHYLHHRWKIDDLNGHSLRLYFFLNRKRILFVCWR